MALQGLASAIQQVMPAALATGLFSSLVTFQDRAGGDNPLVDALGQVDLSNADYVDVSGLVDLKCMFAVERPGRPDVAGMRTPEYFVESAERHLLLDGYYPTVQERFIAVVDDVIYEITPGSVENDSQKQMTRLAVRAYNL